MLIFYLPWVKRGLFSERQRAAKTSFWPSCKPRDRATALLALLAHTPAGKRGGTHVSVNFGVPHVARIFTRWSDRRTVRDRVWFKWQRFYSGWPHV
jgi:hypothetical protein